jgi:L,D-transpeptidase catalytic domain
MLRLFRTSVMIAFAVQPLVAQAFVGQPAQTPTASAPAPVASAAPVAPAKPPVIFQSGTGHGSPASASPVLPRPLPPPRPQIACAALPDARTQIIGRYYPQAAMSAAAAVTTRASTTPNRTLAKSLFDKSLESYLASYCSYGGTGSGPGVIIVVDFAKNSREPRLYRIDLNAGNGIDTPILVAHGVGSDRDDDGFAESFSNVPESYASSLGAARGAEIYDGKNGRSLRLDGLDQSNYLMRYRDIVVHSYAPERRRYFNASLIATRGKPGVSEGCFVVEPDKREWVLQTLAYGGFLYAGYGGVLPQPAVVRPVPANATITFASGTGASSPRSAPAAAPATPAPAPVSGTPAGTSGSQPTAPISPTPTRQPQ